MRFKGQHTAWAGRLGSTHVISSVLKLMIVEMKFSLINIPRSCLQSSSPSPSNTQMDSTASLTAAGGLARVRTSTRCCFLIALTAVGCGKGQGRQTTVQNKTHQAVTKACKQYKNVQNKIKVNFTNTDSVYSLCTVSESFHITV